MFVNLNARNVGEVDLLAGPHHKVGEDVGFRLRHVVEIDRHKKGRHLVIGDLATGVAIDQILNFLGAEFFTIAFASDQIDSTHYCLKRSIRKT